MRLDEYATAFAKLRVNTARSSSPHKPCMLLAVLDLAEAGALERNDIRYVPNLLERYEAYFDIVRTPNDAIFAVFDSAAATIRCACAIRDGVGERGMAVRIGIRAGEVESDGGTISGITVNTGARVEKAAKPGEVLATKTVKDLVAGSGITFTDRGTHLLKGIPGEWQLFAPVVPGLSSPES